MMGHEVNILTDHTLSRSFHPGTTGNENVRAQTESHIIGVSQTDLVKHNLWRPLESGRYLGCSNRQLFAGPNEERDALPSPGLDMKTHCRESFNLGVRPDPFGLAITPV